MFWLPDRIRHLKYRSITILSHIQVRSSWFHLYFNHSHFLIHLHWQTCQRKKVMEQKKASRNAKHGQSQLPFSATCATKKQLRETQPFFCSFFKLLALMAPIFKSTPTQTVTTWIRLPPISQPEDDWHTTQAVFISPSSQIWKNPPNWGRQAEKVESSSHSTVVPPTWRMASLTGSRGARSKRTDHPRWPGVRLQLITSP